MKRLICLLLVLLLPLTSQAAGVLRLMMPDNTVAYVRLLGSGDFTGAAPGTALQQALQNAGKNLHLSEHLLAGMEKNKALQTEAPGLELLYRLSAPVEAVVLAPQDNQIPNIKVLLRARIDADSMDDVKALMQRLLRAYPGELKQVSAMDANGVFELTWQNTLPVVVKFNPRNRSLYLLTGLRADRDSLDKVLASMKIVDQHPMHALEQQVDDSTQGVFAWVDLPRLLEIATTVNPDPTLNAQLGALNGIRGIAMGWGSREGKGRLSLIIDAPKASSLNRMLPSIVNDYSLTARGDLGLMFSINLPGPALLKIGEGMLARDQQAFAEYQENKQQFTQVVGMSPEQLLAIFGPEMLVFGDSNGTFSGIKIGDQKGLQQLLKNLAENPHLEYETRTRNGHTYHHLAFRLIPEEEVSKPSSGSALESYFVNMYLSTKTHLYWTQEDEWLIFSQVPQSLFDRHNDPRVVGIGDWLLKQQRQHAENAVMLLSVQQDQMPRSLYHAYLMVLETMADMVGTKADLLALPGAKTLQLPSTGSYGIQLDLGDPYLRVEFTFEANPLEVLLNGNPMTTVATMGILAAIAVPAYQDYMVRAQVAQLIAETTAAKTAITEYYIMNGYAPADEKSAGLENALENMTSELLTEAKIVDGSIVLTFGYANSQIAGDSLRFTPYVSSNNPGEIVWRCANADLSSSQLQLLPGKDGKAVKFVESTVASKYLPQACR